MKASSNHVLRDAIVSHPFCRDLSERHIELLVEAAMLTEFKAGEVIFKEGDPANRFYIIQSGDVALESQRPEGGAVAIQTIGAGDVLGWSWLFPPYYWHFDARAITDTKAIFFYGTWLRDSCERDHDFGYTMLKRMSSIVIDRLQSARRQLIEMAKAAQPAS